MFKTIDKIRRESQKKSLNKNDNWEYIMTDTLSRHYSYTNVLSKLSLRQQRVVGFDNELFDLLIVKSKIRLNTFV